EKPFFKRCLLLASISISGWLTFLQNSDKPISTRRRKIADLAGAQECHGLFDSEKIRRLVGRFLALRWRLVLWFLALRQRLALRFFALRWLFVLSLLALRSGLVLRFRAWGARFAFRSFALRDRGLGLVF